MKKRFLSLFLCLSLLAVIVPARTFRITSSAAEVFCIDRGKADNESIPRTADKSDVVQNQIINDIQLAVPNTKAGGKAEWSASVPEKADYKVEDRTAYFTANGVTWYNEKGTTVTPGKTLNFEVGKTYKVTVSLEPADKESHKFASDGSMTAKVNGNTAEVHVTSDDKCLVIYSFTAKNMIDNVAVTIDAPKAGEPLSYAASAPSGADYEIYPYTSDPSVDLWKDGVAWLRNGTEQVHPGQNAIAGQKHLVYIKLRSKDKVNNPFDYVSNVTATVNGEKAKILKNSDNTYHVYYTFPVLKDSVTITSISVTVPGPEAGGQITYGASVPTGSGYMIDNTSSGYKKNGVRWTCQGSDINPTAANVFYSGRKYTVYVYLCLSDITKYKFAGENEMNAAINGKKATFKSIDDRSCTVYYTFTLPYAKGDVNGDGEVDSLDATTALKYDSGSIELNDDQLDAGDVTGDYEVDSVDATMILKYDSGAINEL